MVDLNKATSSDETLDMLKDWFEESEDLLSNARTLAHRDRDFKDGKQHTQEEVQELQRRNQPVVTINRIQPKINFIYGQEVRTRVDPRAWPVTPHHEDDALIVTDMLRATADEVKFNRIRGAVFQNVAVEGIGAAVLGIKTKKTHGGKKRTCVTCAHVPFDRFFYDPHSSMEDFSDALYMGIVLWRDYKEAQRDRRFRSSEAQDSLEQAKANGTDGTTPFSETYDDKPIWWDSKRKRVRIIEIYYRQSDEDGDEQWYRAFFCGGGMLVPPKKVEFEDEDGQTYCPLIATSAFVNRELERYGIVRPMISPQEEINKRRSKALHLLSFRQVIAESDAFENEQEALTELAKPDGLVKVRHGVLSENRMLINPTGDLAQGHVALHQEAKNDLDQSGPHAALVNATQRELSGRSILAQLDAGSQELAPVFDNLRDWTLRCFRAMWYLIRQYKTEEDYVRVRDDAGKGYRFVPVNRRMTRAERTLDLMQHGHGAAEAVGLAFNAKALMDLQQLAKQAQVIAQQAGGQPPPEQAILQLFLKNHPDAEEQWTENELARLDVDLSLETVPDTAVAEHEEFLEMLKLAGQGVQIPPRALIEASSLRSKRKILAELDKPPPPAVIRQQQLQLEAMQAELNKLKAETQKIVAQAAESMSKAREGVPAEATRDEAHAVKLLAEADQISSQPPGTPEKDKK